MSHVLNKLKGKQFILVTIALFVFLTAGSIAYAAVHTKCSTDCYEVAHGSAVTINPSYGDCRIVTNNSTVGGDLSLPIKSAGEWFRFRLAAGDKDSQGNYLYTSSGFTNYLQSKSVTVANCPLYDACPNILLIQPNVPAGDYVDQSGDCVIYPNTCPSDQYYWGGQCNPMDPNECTPGTYTTICFPNGRCAQISPGFANCP